MLNPFLNFRRDLYNCSITTDPFEDLATLTNGAACVRSRIRIKNLFPERYAETNRKSVKRVQAWRRDNKTKTKKQRGNWNIYILWNASVTYKIRHCLLCWLSTYTRLYQNLNRCTSCCWRTNKTWFDYWARHKRTRGSQAKHRHRHE